MRSEAKLSIVAALAMLLSGGAVALAASQAAPTPLASPQRFAGIKDETARSAAIFVELGKVLTSPRCLNCHPSGDRPHQRQGAQRRPHEPPVERGADGHGLPAMRCQICHHDANFDPGRVPGHHEWHLAPREMGWEGRSLAEICMQIKDPRRNGNRSLDQLTDHIGKDTLVGWAWKPGFGREPAPGTQAQAGALVAAWVKTGAACPQ